MMSMLMKIMMRKRVLGVLAAVGIIMVLILYHLDVFITKRADQHVPYYHKTTHIGQGADQHVPYYHKAIHNGQDTQPHWLEGVRRDGVTHNLSDVDLDKMTKDQIFLTLHSYLDNIDIVCRRKLRMGHIDDGGWEICDDVDVRPTPPCTVYSYGINNDWSFDDDISKLYGCHVHSFDPSIDLDTHNRSSHVHFYKVGIAGQRTVTEDKWQLYRHQEIRSLLDHEDIPIDIIKMDVENAEWKSLGDMAATEQFRDVKQLFVEFHVSKRKSFHLEKLKILKLLEISGFKRFYVHKNKKCKIRDLRFPILRTFCYEVHYIKRD